MLEKDSGGRVLMGIAAIKVSSLQVEKEGKLS